MTTVALRGLLGRKFRALLTGIAIVLGVAMISGTLILTNAIDNAFNRIFSQSYANTDAYITGKAPDITVQDSTPDEPPLSAALLRRVRSLPHVEAATGSVIDDLATKILNRKGKAINTHGAPSFGFGIDPSYDRFNPLNLVDGRWALNADEVVIDAGTADDEGYRVGERVAIATLQPVRKFRLVGIARYGDVNSLGSATFAVFTIPAAQHLLDREGQFDAISVAATNGTTPAQLVRELRTGVPGKIEVKTGAQQASDERSETASFTSFIRYFLLAFGAIALFVGAFVIFNTLSITVAQRTRELATLRTLGASRFQVLRSVVLEGLVIGVVASFVGLALGVALARGLDRLFEALNLDLPTTSLTVTTGTIIAALVVGVVVTLLASLFPAIRATRVPPIAAVREGAELPRGRGSRVTPYVALAVIALAVSLLGYGMLADDVPTGQRLLSIAFGCLLLFVGVALISSRLVRPLAALVGLPSRQLGGTAGSLAYGNSLRNPGRTAATAAALMIGLALVTFVAVLANGMKQSNRGAIEEQVTADYVVTSQSGWEPFVAGAGDAVARVPRTELATSVRSDLGQAAGKGVYVTGIDPRSIAEVYRFDWKDGSDAVLGQLGRNGAIVDDDFAEDKNLRVGSRFQLVTPAETRRELVVKGIYEPPPFYPLLGNLSIAKNVFDRIFDRPRNQFTFVNVPGGPTEQAQKPLDAALAKFPDAKVQTREAWIKQQDKDFNQFLTMLYVLLALSVIVSVFGMVNTLVLSVFERTREVGMLRAVGMTRRQVRRMIRHESVITALIGAALGLPLGMFLAALVTRALSRFDVRYAVPALPLVVFALVAILVGVVAAIMPARRAAGLRVLEALQYE